MHSPEEVNAPAPIFLICSERSGSNLIASMVGAHPDVYAHPPYHIGRDLLLKLHDAMAGGTSSPAMQVLTDSAAKRIGKYRGEDEAARFRVWIEQQDRLSPHDIARFVFQEMPPEAQGKHAFIKENNVHQLLFFFVDCFPDAKFVFQVRDPRDFLLSAKARKMVWLGNKFGSVRNALNVWREDQLGGLTALGLLGPDRVHLQRYEDLVGNSEESLGKLCKFLRIDYDEKMLAFHEEKSAQQLAVKGGPRENLGKPLMTQNFRKYRKGLSRGQVKTVEAYVGDLMDRFGYPREYTGIASPGFYSSLKPQLTEPLERWMNRDLRPQYKTGNRRLKRDLDAAVEPLCPPLWED